ncbi:hypothetical protein BDW75DRAFT_207801 [Aspergillus navahoensis]
MCDTQTWYYKAFCLALRVTLVLCVHGNHGNLSASRTVLLKTVTMIREGFHQFIAKEKRRPQSAFRPVSSERHPIVGRYRQLIPVAAEQWKYMVVVEESDLMENSQTRSQALYLGD